MKILTRSYLLFLLCADGSLAFIPKSVQYRSWNPAYSTLKRHDFDQATTEGLSSEGNEEWLTNGIERDASLRRNVVIGPKEILVYDTTLRGRTASAFVETRSIKLNIN
jgi:hypothetical protein